MGAYQAMRTVQALERLAFRPLSAPELAAALQIHQRTARRLLQRLHAEDYATLLPGPRRRYRLTRRLAALGREAIARDDLPLLAAPWVAKLAAQTGHPAQLWIPCYTDVVCVLAAKPDGPTPEPALGELAPAHATAPGKALMAHRERWRDSLLTQRLPCHAPQTHTDPDDLRAALERTRRRGFATEAGEHEVHVHAIAAAVFVADDAIAALAVTLTVDEHAAGDHDALTAHTVRAAATLTSVLGRPSGTPPDAQTTDGRSRAAPTALRSTPSRRG